MALKGFVLKNNKGFMCEKEKGSDIIIFRRKLNCVLIFSTMKKALQYCKSKNLKISKTQRIVEVELRVTQAYKRKIGMGGAKAKGREFQKFICKKIAELFNISYVQDDDNCPIHSREMGQKGTDVALRGEIYEKFPFDIECKRTEKISLYDGIEQAKANTKESRNWLLFHKRNDYKSITVMDTDVFFKLMKELNDFREEAKGRKYK
jgi:hypothetical protein